MNTENENGSRKTGFLKKYVAHRGFGFISPEDGGDDIFVHASAFIPPIQRDESPPYNQHVSFEMGKGDRSGKPGAIAVKLIGEDYV